MNALYALTARVSLGTLRSRDEEVVKSKIIGEGQLSLLEDWYVSHSWPQQCAHLDAIVACWANSDWYTLQNWLYLSLISMLIVLGSIGYVLNWIVVGTWWSQFRTKLAYKKVTPMNWLAMSRDARTSSSREWSIAFSRLTTAGWPLIINAREAFHILRNAEYCNRFPETRERDIGARLAHQKTMAFKKRQALIV